QVDAFADNVAFVALDSYHWLTWTNFHNARIQILEHDVGWGPWTTRPQVKGAARQLGANYIQRVGGGIIWTQWPLQTWNYESMIADISQLGTLSAYIYC